MCSLKTNPVFLQSNCIIMPTPIVLKFRILGTSQFSRSLRHFWRGLEDPRTAKIYSSGNRGVKKGPGPRGSRDEEFLVPYIFFADCSALNLQKTSRLVSQQFTTSYIKTHGDFWTPTEIFYIQLH